MLRLWIIYSVCFWFNKTLHTLSTSTYAIVYALKHEYKRGTNASGYITSERKEIKGAYNFQGRTTFQKIWKQLFFKLKSEFKRSFRACKFRWLHTMVWNLYFIHLTFIMIMRLKWFTILLCKLDWMLLNATNSLTVRVLIVTLASNRAKKSKQQKSLDSFEEF